MSVPSTVVVSSQVAVGKISTSFAMKRPLKHPSPHIAHARPSVSSPVLPLRPPSVQVVQAAEVSDLYLAAAVVTDTGAYPDYEP